MKTIDNPVLLSSQFYDEIYKDRPDRLFYEKIARRFGKGTIWECGCGTGRIALLLAQKGFQLDCVDLSRHRLAIFKERLRHSGTLVQQRISIRQGNMATTRMRKRYSLILMPFRSFQHLLTPKQQRQALRNFYCHLIAGGRLVIDIFNPSIPMLGDKRYLSPFGDGRILVLADGRKMLFYQRICSRNYSAQTQESEEIFKIADTAGRVWKSYSLRYETRYTFKYELEYLLRLEGFKIEYVWGDYDCSPFGMKYPGEILLVAKR